MLLNRPPQPSRVGADFTVEIFDWNQIEQAKSLGIAKIDLADIEPFTAIERTLSLTSNKHGEKGQIRIRLMFQPEIIAKSRKNTSTFSTAGRAMTQIGSIPLGAGKGVFHGVTGVFKRNKDDDSEPENEAPSGQASQPIPIGNGENGNGNFTAFPTSDSGASIDNGGGGGEPGTLRVTVLDAKDLPSNDYKPYAIIRIGDKEVKTKHTGKTATPEWYVDAFRTLVSSLISLPGMNPLFSRRVNLPPSCSLGFMITKRLARTNC